MKSIVKIKQKDLTDCGVSCLASVAAYYGKFIPLSKLRQYASTNRTGTNVAGLLQAADRIGMEAKGVKADFSHLQDFPYPLIAHIVVNNLQHYIVLYRFTPRHIKYMDPADGCFHTFRYDEFKSCWTGIVILLQPKDSFRPGDERVPEHQRFLQLVRPHRFVLVQAIIASAILTVLGLIPSIYIQKIVDHVLPNENYRLLNLLSIIMLASLTLQVLLGYVKSLFVLQTGLRLDARLILGYYRHLLHLPQKFFDSMQVGELMSRVNDAVKIRSFLSSTAIEMLMNLFILLFSLLLMFFYSAKLAILVVAFFPCYGAIFLLSNRINRKWQRKIMEDAARVETELVESLNNIRTVRKLGVEPYMYVKGEERVAGLLKSVFKTSSYNIHLNGWCDAVLKVLTVSVLWAGSYFVLRKEMTTGELLSFYSLLGYFSMPATAILASNRSYQEAVIAANRLFEIIDLEAETAEQPVIHLSKDQVDDIHLADISFNYGNRGMVFNGLTTSIRKGRKTAFAGESGSGKSTLFSLLLKIYPPANGTIKIGGTDIRYFSNESIRNHIGIVPQEIQLISGTIIENIAVGVYEPDLERVIQVSAKLGLDEMIAKLPEGYHTHLTEAGMNLSGGQRQRIAIARALYRQPEILLLDEATSALDLISERKIKEALNWYTAQGNTLVVISHKLSYIKDFDVIKFLKDGKIAEEGTHDELMKMDGYYRQFWIEQYSDRSVEKMPV